MTKATGAEKLTPNEIYEIMKKNDKFIGDVLAPFEQALGMKFNNFEKPEDPKFVAPKKKNLKLKLKIAQRNEAKLKKLSPEDAKQAKWKKAIEKAKGVKNKDDPKVIKKIIKKKENSKKKSKKQWGERLANKKSAIKKEKRKKERKAKTNK